ncbi:MAG: hypothetical protein ABF932_04585 [Gluconobacter potus]|uniref:hypothetical protein n=1 Tax=Gluconobacter TaxID=441 RepID=UPI001D1789AF|nr:MULTISPECIES: hypothetical protein [Gluconobacter]
MCKRSGVLHFALSVTTMLSAVFSPSLMAATCHPAVAHTHVSRATALVLRLRAGKA